MKYVTATSDMANTIYNILHTTIKTIYPKYYPKEVVDFFCHHHSKEHILDGILSGNMGVLVYNNIIAGTGCFDNNMHLQCFLNIKKCTIIYNLCTFPNYII